MIKIIIECTQLWFRVKIKEMLFKVIFLEESLSLMMSHILIF